MVMLSVFELILSLPGCGCAALLRYSIARLCGCSIARLDSLLLLDLVDIGCLDVDIDIIFFYVTGHSKESKG